MTASITYRSSGGVATVTLARPEIRNALTGEDMLDELLDSIDAAEADPDVGVMILSAEGPAFSAGGNVKDMAERRGLFSGPPSEIVERYRDSIQQVTRFMATTDLVTIAAVDGPAIGAGFDLVLGCDLRIGTRRAEFAHTFIDLGIVPGDGGAWILPRVVGWQRAAELAFTARRVGGPEAKDMGILLELVGSDQLDQRVGELAASIASKPRPAVVMTKRLLRQSRSMSLDGFLELSAALQAVAHTTEEHGEAAAGFVRRLTEGD